MLFPCRQTEDGIKLFLGGLSWSLSEGEIRHSVVAYSADTVVCSDERSLAGVTGADQVRAYFESRYGPVKEVVSPPYFEL